MVIRGVENLYMFEIEEFMHLHTKILDVYVIGVLDMKYWEELMAWVKVKPGQTLTEDEIKEFLSGRIARHKVHHYYKFVD